MSTLDGALPLGLGITKLRLWDELHRAHCEKLQHCHVSSSSPSKGRFGTKISAELGLLPSAGPPLRDLSMPCALQSAPEFGNGFPEDRSHETTTAKRRRIAVPNSTQGNDSLAEATCAEFTFDHALQYDSQTSLFDWFWSNDSRDNHSRPHANILQTGIPTEPTRDEQGVLMPPPPPKPGPTRRNPPPLFARIRAKARRAKRKQQKAEYRRRLFLAHMVQATREARQQIASSSVSSRKLMHSTAAAEKLNTTVSKTVSTRTARQEGRQAITLFPERLGVDLASFVEIVFDTDAQSSEITAPSEISDDDLARATQVEIEMRKRLGGSDAVVPKGVFRWMVAGDFAERWPQKVQGVRKNPWPGLEDVWGLPSEVALGGKSHQAQKVGVEQHEGPVERDEEPIRWQSGRRSRFMRRKEKKAPQDNNVAEDGAHADSLADNALERPSWEQSTSGRAATSHVQKAGRLPVPVSVPDVLPAIRMAPRPEDLATRASDASATSKLHSGGPDLSCETAEPILTSLDWSNATSCLYPAVLPSTTTGVPIRL